MATRITRRTFVGRLARSASAAAVLGLLPAVAPEGRAAPAAAAAPAPVQVVAPARASQAGPVPVRMADLVLAGRELWAGRADGVRLPGQGGDTWGLVAERPGATYTTPSLQTAFPCSHIGAHWTTDGGDQTGLRAEVRVSRDGSAWQPWRTVRPEAHGPDRAGASVEPETFGALVRGRLARWVQARLTFERAGPDVVAVRSLTLTCLDSRDAGAQAGGPPSLGGEGRPPSPGGEGRPSDLLRAGLVGFLDRVVPREAWGADESLRFKDGAEVWPTAFVMPSLLVVHHTETENDYTDPASEIRAIYAYHAVTQGWGDIGYHLLIDSSGQAYEGRRGREPDADGRREIVSENVVAGHALDYNYGSVGVALLGSFQDREPGPAMLDTLVEALAFFAQRASIDPTARISYPRSRSDGTAFWRDALASVSGHRDCIPTLCPGTAAYALLPALRQRVDTLLGARGPAVRIARGPSERNLWPTDLGFAWEPDPATAEVSVRLEGWRRVPGSDRIVALSGYDADERPIWEPWSRQQSLSVPLPPDAHGIYVLQVRARDAAGRAGRVVARWPLVVDRHAVVDDEDAARTERDGNWRASSTILGYNGTQYQAASAADATARFRWRLAVPEDGTYGVQASWTEAPDRTIRAVYRIGQGGQTLGEAAVSQQTSGGRWVDLLDVPLAAGTPCVVELVGDADGALVADAVRLVRRT